MPPKKASESKPIGKKVKSIRTQKKMTLDQIANDTGCSIDYLKKIESCKEMPPVGTLLRIARALHIDSGDLLKESQETLQQRAQSYTKRTKNYAYTTLTPGAENKHLKAFRVNIKAGQEHEGVGYQHEGEEFIYVLTGQVEVAIGEHINALQTNGCLHFNSAIVHNIRNVGDSDAELVVVIYNP
ncbi:MAG: helix-turn-helix domain-containing protein [Desulfobacteraceae bacterium]|nr:helix-turn-helix domain-containing protein [Desulfobacteraceae bacterium]